MTASSATILGFKETLKWGSVRGFKVSKFAWLRELNAKIKQWHHKRDKSVQQSMPACLINPSQRLERCLNSPHSSAVLALAMTEPQWVSDGMRRLMPLHQPLPAPQGEVCSGGPWVFLSPNGPRLLVSNYIVLLPDPQQYLFSYFHPFLLST